MEDFLKFSSRQNDKRREVTNQAETRNQHEEDALNHEVKCLVPVLGHYLELIQSILMEMCPDHNLTSTIIYYIVLYVYASQYCNPLSMKEPSMARVN